MPSVFFHTFGCKVNQYETESAKAKLLKLGYETTRDVSSSDVCVINSCSVTEEADSKCRKFVRRVLRSNPKARVLVTGCYATRDPEALRSLSPRIEIFSNQEKDLIPQALSGCSLAAEEAPLITFFGGRTRAFVKVQDGCDATCTYCVIPKLRPQMASRPLQEILSEVRGLLSAGFKEIVLTGIRLGSFGLTGSGGRVGRVHGNLADLLLRLTQIPEDFRVRLSSLEITEMTDELLEVIRATEKVCPHFHLPLQSGDDAVLRRMGRWYDTGYFISRLEAVKSVLPDSGFTTDVIAGFPGETDAQFQNTYNFLETHFHGMHVFPFSARRGTPAQMLPQACSPRVIRGRVNRLLELDKSLRAGFRIRFSGSRRRVLAESGGGFTDNGIRLPLPLPFPEGTLDWAIL